MVNKRDKQLDLRIKAKLENLSVVADFISNSIRQLGVNTSIFEIQMAVDEACTNIIKYAYSEGDGVIDITCDVQENNLIVTIRDKGKPFDPQSVAPPDLHADLNQRKIGGIGIFLMKKLMDDVSYSFNDISGNLLTMRKRL